MERPTRRAILQSSLGVAGGYLAGEYGFNDHNDLLRGIQSVDGPRQLPIPPTISPSYQWQQTFPDSVRVITATAEAIVTAIGEQIVVLDANSGATVATYFALGSVAEGTVVDGKVLTIADNGSVTGVDIATNEVFQFSIPADQAFDNVFVFDEIIVLVTEEAAHAYSVSAQTRLWQTTAIQSATQLGRFIVLGLDGRVIVRRPDGTRLLDREVDDESPFLYTIDNRLIGGTVKMVIGDHGGGVIIGGGPTVIFSPDGDVETTPRIDDSYPPFFVDDGRHALVPDSPSNRLLVVNTSNATVIRQFDITNGFERTETVTVAAGTDDIVGLSGLTGELKWRRQNLQVRTVVDETPDGILVEVATDTPPHRYVVLDKADGQTLGTFESQISVTDRNLIDGPTGPIFVGEDGFLVLDTDTHESVFSHAVSEPDIESCTESVLTVSWDDGAGFYDAHTGAELSAFGPGSHIIETQEPDDGNAIVALGSDGDGTVFWATTDQSIYQHIAGDTPTSSLQLYRDRVVIPTPSAADTELVDLELVGPEGRVLYTASAVDVSERSSITEIMTISSEGETRFLRSDGTTTQAGVSGGGDITFSETDNTVFLQQGRHLTGYGIEGLRRRWRITTDSVMRVVARESVVYVLTDRLTCLDAQTGIPLYTVDDYVSFDQLTDGYSTAAQQPPTPLIAQQNTVGRVAQFGTIARKSLTAFDREASALEPSVETLLDAAGDALDAGSEIKAQRLVATAYSRRELRSPAAFDGVTGAFRRPLARLLGYRETLTAADEAAKATHYRQTQHHLVKAQAAINRTDTLSTALAGLLGGLMFFLPAMIREQRLEPDRVADEARERIRLAGTMCTQAYARGQAIEELHVAKEALDRDAYSEALDAATTSIKYANREAELLERLANATDEDVHSLREFDYNSVRYQLAQRVVENAVEDENKAAVEEAMTATESDPDSETPLTQTVITHISAGEYDEAETKLDEATGESN